MAEYPAFNRNVPSSNLGWGTISVTARRKAWLIRLLWEQEIASSNLATRTTIHSLVVQSAERCTVNANVGGSNPPEGAKQMRSNSVGRVSGP